MILHSSSTLRALFEQCVSTLPNKDLTTASRCSLGWSEWYCKQCQYVLVFGTQMFERSHHLPCAAVHLALIQHYFIQRNIKERCELGFC